MPILVVDESSYMGPIPDDTVLRAEVVSVKGPMEHKFFKNDDGTPQVTYEFSFVVDDEDSEFHGQRVWGNTPTTFNDDPRCKLHNWAMAIIGQDLPVDTAFNTDDLVGEHCRIVVKQNKYKDKDDIEQIRNKVADVMPVKGSSRPTSVVDDEPF